MDRAPRKQKKKKRDIFIISLYINLFAASLGVDPALRECLWRCDERNCPPPWERCSRFVHTPRQQQGETSPAVRCPSDVPVTSQLSPAGGDPQRREWDLSDETYTERAESQTSRVIRGHSHAHSFTNVDYNTMHTLCVYGPRDLSSPPLSSSSFNRTFLCNGKELEEPDELGNFKERKDLVLTVKC